MKVRALRDFRLAGRRVFARDELDVDERTAAYLMGLKKPAVERLPVRGRGTPLVSVSDELKEPDKKTKRS